MSVRQLVIVADDIEASGGVQKVAHVLSSAFIGRGYQVTLLGVNNSAKSSVYRRDPRVKVDSIFRESYAEVAARARSGSSREFKSTVRLEYEKTRIVGREKLDQYLSDWTASTVLIVFQLHALKLLVEAGLFERVHRPRVFAQYHGSYDYAEKRGYVADLIDCFNMVDQALFLTAEEAAFFGIAGVHQARFIANPLTSPLPVLENDGLSSRGRLAVSICRLHAEKNLDDLLHAWAFLPEGLDEWRLDIYGVGPERKRLEDLTRTLNLSTSVRFMGEIQNPVDALLAARVHLLTSHHEGWGLVIGEAAACGVPTISYDSGPGVREQIVSGADGMLVHQKDPRAFSAALAQVLSDDRLLNSLGENARAKVKSSDPATVIAKWEELLGHP